MSQQYHVKGTSHVTAEVEDLPLSDPGESLTRRILRMKLVDNIHSNVDRVEATLMHQRRRSARSGWEDVDSYSLATLKSGQEVRLKLSAAETRRLFTSLEHFYTVTRAGVPSRDSTYEVVNSDTALVVRGRERDFLRVLMEQQGGSFFDIITELQPEAVESFAHARIVAARRGSYATFEKQLAEGTWSEKSWEDFFRDNPWIFGYGLTYRFLSEVMEQPYVGGKTFSGSGGQVGDFLMASEAEIAKFTVLVDIKKPSAKLLNEKQYRNGAYAANEEVVDGVAQLQSNCRRWVVSARQQENLESLDAASVYTVEPKGILVIGHTGQLAADDPAKARHRRESFESFRRNLTNPEILTYDELCNRARLIVSMETDRVDSDGKPGTNNRDEPVTDDSAFDGDNMSF